MAEIKQIKVGDTIYDITANGVVEAVPNTLVQRDQWAGIMVNHAIIQGNPENENDAINIKYLNGRTSVEPTSNTLVQRDEYAGIKANHVIITGENQPENDTDAATKGYIDERAGFVGDMEYIQPNSLVRRDENAGIVVNHAVIKGDPVGDNDAIHKKYVNDNFVPKSSVSKELGANTIVQRNADSVIYAYQAVLSAAPTNRNDAATKAYVDDGFIPKIKKFNNPVIYNTSTQDYYPDPTVWSGDDGYFYALSTSFDKHMYKSVDLVTWTDCGYSPISNSAATTIKNLGYNKIWSPHVVKVGSKWLMYLSCVYNPAGVTSTKSGIAILSSNQCNGYFNYEKMLLTNSSSGVSDCIDPFLDVDPITNKLWLYFGSTGGIKKVELTNDGLSLANNTFTAVAGLTSTQNSTREKVFEGTSIYYRGNYRYIFVSSGFANKPTYQLKVGRSVKNESTGTWSEFTDKSGKLLTSGNATTLLSASTGAYNGPGHCSRVFVDRLDRTFLFFHAHTQYTTGDNWRRATFLQELKWDSNGWPYFANPSLILASEVAPYFPVAQPREILAPSSSEVDTSELQDQIDDLQDQIDDLNDATLDTVSKNAFLYDSANKILTINLDW